MEARSSAFAADILNAEIVHTKNCERYGSIVVSPEAWSDGTLMVAMFI